MDIAITALDDVDAAAYDSFLERASGASFFHTVEYLELLRDLLSCRFRVLLARDDDRLVGVLPLAIAENEELGSVANALPFFGSSAGVIAARDADDAQTETVYRELLQSLTAVADEFDCVVATVITSQFDPHNEPERNPLYEEALDAAFVRERVAQVVEFTDAPPTLPEETESLPDETPAELAAVRTLEEYLFTSFEKRCRRAIRTSYSAGLSREVSTDFRPLHEMHEAGMNAKGGTVKPYEFFELVPEHVPQSRYTLSYARKDGEIVAGLLTFRHGDVVEYHTPAYDYDHRSDQATSFLIFEAMKEALQDGVRYWNFGGTRPSQESLYRFKRGWGAVEYPYHYYGATFGDVGPIERSSPEEVSAAYPWFYVYPFDELGEA